MNHLSNWEESIRSGLANHEVATPATGWEKLESALHAAASADAISSSTSKNHTIPKPTAQRPWIKTLWGKSVVSAASVAVAASVAIVAVRQSEEPLKQAIDRTQQTARQATNAPQAIETPTAAEPTAASNVSRLLAHATQPAAMAHETEEQVPLLKSASESDEEPPSATEEHIAETSNAPTASEAELTHTDADRTSHTDAAFSPRAKSGTGLYKQTVASRSTKRSVNHRPTIAMHFSTPNTQRMSQQGSYYSPSVSLPTGNVHTLSVEQIDFAHVVGTNLDKKVESRVRHKMPFQFGLSVSVPLTKRWSVRTGMTYTRLSTDIQAGSDVAYYVTQQSLHYVGVPLSASYTIYSSRFFNVYAAAGATLEKCVKAKRSTTFDNTSSKRSTASESEGFADGLWQLSLNASAGIQFNFTPAIGLYFEPGVSYYVNDGSSLPNIRHEHPGNLNMQGGLRFSFK